uniref:Beta-hexosaminidase (Beta-N-acetylhexosaminidase) (N-acetyl-beta-glucosaminidase)) n=1 Tax=Ganoderma boninense TaxID=34458 RepID=A0A5K1K765_9APHY|nr:Beta-hexosaminidase (EC (Beta-GlcNAcase) (Beta-N-acetylhexosaminidase) (N-acetyl-beta-glucosaminidase) [Ganoderma boninense]
MSTPEVHQLLIDTVTREHDCVLQFDSAHKALKCWLWPKDYSGALIAPGRLPLRGDDFTGLVEAAMFERGDGEVVAMCATDNCGYLVCLGRIFEKGNMPTATYPKRDDGAVMPFRVFHQSEDTDNVLGQADMEDAELEDGVNMTLDSLFPAGRVLPRPVKYRALIGKLDSKVRPGVPESALKLLFVRCNKCGDVTTRQAFVYHTC